MTLEQILPLLEHYRYFFLFPITVVEGPIITILAGYLSHLGFLNFGLAYLIVVIGDLVGDIIYYFAGYFENLKFFRRWKRYFRINPDKVLKMKKIINFHSFKFLFFGKFSPGLGGIIILAAGSARVPFLKFLYYSTLGTLPKTLILMIVGVYLGNAYLKINNYLNKAAFASIVAAALLFSVYYLIDRYAKKTINK